MAARTAGRSRAAAAGPGPEAPLTLVRGPEQLLADRAVAAVVAHAREADPEVEVTRLSGEEAGPATLMDLLSPSLFGGSRVVVVRGVAGLDEDAVDALRRFAADPAPDVQVVVTTLPSPGTAGRSATEKLAKVARVVKVEEVRSARDRLDVLREDVRLAGRRADDGALRALLEAVPGDLLASTTALRQLLADTTGPVDVDVVARYHRGRGETKGWDVADAALEGRRADAVSLLRWSALTGTPALVVVAALAGGLRQVAQVAHAARESGRARDAELASRLRMPPWKVTRLRAQAQGWRPETLAEALQAVARADLDLKGAAGDAEHALERAVLAVLDARLRGGPPRGR